MRVDRGTPQSNAEAEAEAEDDGIDAALFEGHVDAIEAGRIYGWALDPLEPARRLSVAIFHGDDELGTVVADRFREDLRDYGDGSGRHAFVFTLPKPLWDADPAGFHVTHAGSSVPLVRPGGATRKVPPLDPGAQEGSSGVTPAGAPGGAAHRSPGGAPDWLGPVAARLSHLETALVSTARAAALTQIGLRDLELPPDPSDRLSALEQSQLRIDHALRVQSAAIGELRSATDQLRGAGRLHLVLTLALLAGLAVLTVLALQSGWTT